MKKLLPMGTPGGTSSGVPMKPPDPLGSSAPWAGYTGRMSMRRAPRWSAVAWEGRSATTTASSESKLRSPRHMKAKCRKLPLFTPWNTTGGKPEPPKVIRLPLTYPGSVSLVMTPGSGSTNPSIVGGPVTGSKSEKASVSLQVMRRLLCWRGSGGEPLDGEADERHEGRIAVLRAHHHPLDGGGGRRLGVLKDDGEGARDPRRDRRVAGGCHRGRAPRRSAILHLGRVRVVAGARAQRGIGGDEQLKGELGALPEADLDAVL